eukprot:6765823-Prymnesium_polylepis.1
MMRPGAVSGATRALRCLWHEVRRSMRGLLGSSRRACAVHVARRPARACGATLVQVSARRPR